MLSIFALVGILIILFFYMYNNIKYENAVNNILCSGRDLVLRDLILFSNTQIVKYIKQTFKNNRSSIKIYYFYDEYMTIKKSDTKAEILKKLSYIQEMILEAKCTGSVLENLTIYDNVDEKILDVWLDYGYNDRYRTIFKREMEEKLNSGKISKSCFNMAYRRFYNFERG